MRKRADTGIIVYSSPHVPAEWIAVHGFEPCRVMPDATDRKGMPGERSGICTYARDFAITAIARKDAAAIVLATGCDQMRRMKDMLDRESRPPAFLLNVPATWAGPRVLALYVSELRRMSRFLVSLGGKAPSDTALRKAMRHYEAARSALLAAREALGSRRFSEAVAEFNSTGRRQTRVAERRLATHGTPIAFLGGPLCAGDSDLFDAVERAGGLIVLDGLETGERTMPAPFDERTARTDPLLALAGSYLGIPEVWRRPNTLMYEWLKREVAARDVRGVIMLRHVWCDAWHAEVQRIRESLDLPLLDLDMEGSAMTARNRNRICAFMESVCARRSRHG